MSPPLKKLDALRSQPASPADPKLSPKLERARGKLLTALGNRSLLEALAQLQGAFDGQTSEDNRLANLAAQTWIVRRRLEALQKGQMPALVQDVLAPKPEISAKLKLMSLGGAGGEPPAKTAAEAEAEAEASPAAPTPKPWQKVRILAEAEVNGMVFFEGSTIAVKPEDASKLVSAGKAEVVEQVAAADAKVGAPDRPAPAKPAPKPKAPGSKKAGT